MRASRAMKPTENSVPQSTAYEYRRKGGTSAMKICHKCGQPIEFRFIDGRPTPLHFEGGCSSSRTSVENDRVRRSVESSCIKTSCPNCSASVFFIRHNGGSVWIEPPLGPPWHRHSCMDNEGNGAERIIPRAQASVMDAGLTEELGEREGIITGVVKISEISEDRKNTLLTVEVGESEDLVILVKGGADSFIGKIVIIDGPERRIFCADERRLAFAIPNTLSIPRVFVDAGIDLPGLLGSSKAKKLRSTITPSRLDGLSDKQHQLLAKYKSVGNCEEWKLSSLLQLIAILTGHEKDEVAHIAAIMILEKAEKHGDCSHAADLAALLPPSKRSSLRTWFAEFSPISVDISRKQHNAHFYKPAQKERKVFDVATARRTPFYSIRRILDRRMA